MSYTNTKVYFDGSHYIAIPHTEKPKKWRPKPSEELVNVVEENNEPVEDIEPSISLNSELLESQEVEEKQNDKLKEKVNNLPEMMTKKQIFNGFYAKFIDLPRKKREKAIIQEMLKYFKNSELCELFVKNNMERKRRNLICRRVRMIRKANLVDFNYFVTFTYDDKKHTEDSFKKKLKNALSLFASRKKWKYMGVWERAPETKRLHFHGLFQIPEGTMPGVLEEHSDYNFGSHKRTTTIQNTYFNSRFGRSDFEQINSNRDLMKEIQYICKYLEKTEEKIVYSKGLYQYFISDIIDNDIVCKIGQEDKKLLLFDDFTCWDEGVMIGQVSPETIAQMRKCN